MWTEEEKQKVLFGPGGAEGAEGAVPAGAVPRAAHRELSPCSRRLAGNFTRSGNLHLKSMRAILNWVGFFWPES